MDFFSSKFKKTDDQAAKPTSDDQVPDSSSYATDNYSSGDVTKGTYGDDKPSCGGDAAVGKYTAGEYDQSGGGYGEDGYSKKPSYGGDTTGTDEYEQQPQGGYGEETEKPSCGGATTETDEYQKPEGGGYGEDPEKPSYGGATTQTDEYQKPEAGGYGEDTEESTFSKKPSYGDSTAGTDEYEKPQGFPYGKEADTEDFSEKPSGKETDNYGNYTSTEDFSCTQSGDDAAKGADSGEGYGADATGNYRKKPSGGYGATTGNYASDDKYNE